MSDNWDTYTQEWFEQANYDLETARYLFEGGRYIYAVFMCHLALEKALKSMVVIATRRQPPKSHNLIFLLKKSEIIVNETDDIFVFLTNLNEWCIPTRYPETLSNLKSIFTKSRVLDILEHSERTLSWLMLKK